MLTVNVAIFDTLPERVVCARAVLVRKCAGMLAATSCRTMRKSPDALFSLRRRRARGGYAQLAARALAGCPADRALAPAQDGFCGPPAKLVRCASSRARFFFRKTC